MKILDHWNMILDYVNPIIDILAETAHSNTRVLTHTVSVSKWRICYYCVKLIEELWRSWGYTRMKAKLTAIQTLVDLSDDELVNLSTIDLNHVCHLRGLECLTFVHTLDTLGTQKYLVNTTFTSYVRFLRVYFNIYLEFSSWILKIDTSNIMQLYHELYLIHISATTLQMQPNNVPNTPDAAKTTLSDF